MVAVIARDLEEFVQAEVASGHFSSREEVIAVALKQMRDRHVWEQCVQEVLAEEAATPGDDTILQNEDEMKAFFDDIKARGRERLTKSRVSS